jgi:hypothetical protein
MQRALLSGILILGGTILFSQCVPPPELVEARKKQAEQQRAAALRDAQPVPGAFTQPAQPTGPVVEVPLAPAFSTRIKQESLASKRNYFDHLGIIYLKSSVADFKGEFIRVDQTKQSLAVSTIDINSLFDVLRENGYTVYMVSGFIQEDLLYLLQYDLPFYASLKTYCNAGPVDFKSQLILVSGYKDYVLGEPERGTFTYQGFYFLTMKMQHLVAETQSVFVPVKDPAVLEQVQAAWRGFHQKMNTRTMPQIFELPAAQPGGR